MATPPWETVRIFISSTFEDMHAERDYLVKQVFPELREWCEQRRLHLVDIDLRWGVREEDTQNKNVVEVCLRRIDEARPFFLCFLGQRRGWVPGPDDVSANTLSDTGFPDLRESLGNSSVTELEIMHALINPFHRSRMQKDSSPEQYDPVKHALFFLREPSYLQQLPADFPDLRKLFTNEAISDPQERSHADRELQRWVNTEIPALCAERQRPLHTYSAQWNPAASSPELLLPIHCPSTAPEGIRQWQNKWAQAGIPVSGTSITDPALLQKAQEHNQKRAGGRLGNFTAQGEALQRVIIEALKRAIMERYPEHVVTAEPGDLQKELDQQQQFMHASCAGFIARSDDFSELDAYVNSPDARPLVLTAPGGTGKSTLLANWIEHRQAQMEPGSRQSIHYRFIGQSDRSTSINALLHYLLREIKEVSGKIMGEIPPDPKKLRQELPKLLEAAGRQGKTIIVIDALNQLETGLSDLSWLPFHLPGNIKLIISFKQDEPAASATLQQMQRESRLVAIKPFTNPEHRRMLVQTYLSHYLKQLDERHLETLIQFPGAQNPLFLKVVLSELRVFGAFANLGEKIRSDFGETPVSAFEGVLKRLENDPAYSPVEPKTAVPLLFGLLAHARQGLSIEELTGLFVQALGMQDTEAARLTASDSIFLYLRQVNSFLAYRDGRVDFFYESFKLAAQRMYTGAPLPKRSSKDWHELLGHYFYHQPLTMLRDGSPILYRNKVSEQVYHLAKASSHDKLADTLTDFGFIHGGIQLFGTYQFCDQFKLLDLPDLKMTEDVKATLLSIQNAILLSAHVINHDPDQLAGQLIGRLQAQKNNLTSRLIKGAEEWWSDRPWLYPSSVKLNTPGGALLATLDGVQGGSALVCTPDGKKIALASKHARSVQLWDVEQAKLLRNFGEVSEAAFTPDGRRAALFVNAKSALEKKVDCSVVDLQNGEVIQSLQESTGNVVKSAITPDGQYAVSVSHHGSVLKIWDRSDGKLCGSFPMDCLAEYKVLNADRLLALCYQSLTPQQNANAPKTLSLWDLTTGEVLHSFNHIDHSPVLGFTATTDGQKIITRSYKTITIWNSNTQEALAKIDCPEIINFLEATADHQKLVAACHNGHFYVWDLEKMTEYSHFQSKATMQNRIAISPDSKRLLSYVMNTVEIWDIDQAILTHTFSLQNETITKIEMLLNGKQACIFSAVKTKGSMHGIDHAMLHLIDIDTGLEVTTFMGGNPIAATLDGKYVVSAYTIDEKGRRCTSCTYPHSEFVFWDMEHAQELPGLTGVKTEHITFLSISDDGKHIISGNRAGRKIKVWDSASGEQVHTIEGISGMSSLAFSACGRYIVSDSDCYRMNMWDLEKGITTYSVDCPIPGSVFATRQGDRIAVPSMDGALYLWDILAPETGPKLFAVSDSAENFRFSISPDGKTLLIFFGIQGAAAWDIETQEAVFQKDKVMWINNAVGISADGSFFLAKISSYPPGNQKDRLALIDPNNSETPVDLSQISPEKDSPVYAPLHTGLVEAAYFSPDGQLLVTRRDWRQVDIWDLATGLVKQTLALDSSRGQTEPIMAITKDGSRLITNMGSAVQVWALEQLEPSAGSQDERESKIEMVRVAPDGERAMIGKKGHVTLAEMEGLQEIYTLQLPYIELKSSFISFDGARLILNRYGRLEIRNLENGEEIYFINKPFQADITPDQKYAVIDLIDSLVKVDLQTGQEVCRGKKDLPAHDRRSIHVSDDGARVILRLVNDEKNQPKDYFFSIFDMEQGQQMLTQTSPFISLLDADQIGQKYLVLVNSEGIQAWNIQTGKEQWARAKVHGKAKILPGEQRLIIEDYGAGMPSTLFDLASGEEIMKLAGMGKLVKILPDGKRALFSNMKIYQLDDFSEQGSLDGEQDSYQAFAFCQNGQFAWATTGMPGVKRLSDSGARLIKVWHVDSGKLLGTMTMDYDITAFDISPDGLSVLAGDVLGQVHLMKLRNV